MAFSKCGEAGALMNGNSPQEVIPIPRPPAERPPTMSDYRSGLAETYNNLGAFYERTGQFLEAEIAYKEAIALWKGLADAHPEISAYRLSLANSYNGLGDICKHRGRAEQAQAAHREAEAIRRTVAAQAPPDLHKQGESSR
jgi:tetratricopeptide (TPR) repeat protein